MYLFTSRSLEQGITIPVFQTLRFLPAEKVSIIGDFVYAVGT
jgi:hypothetical protein